ncbi:hypothetical protein BASA83_007285 [Batrachochytrium salamandrivorans]|nr:hypothetical protein BASA83_007285 [Batrachochytrium salamandrivorans]
MILAKVPNFTPECLWIVGSVYVGHSGATINYSRREAFASIRQALDRVVPFRQQPSCSHFRRLEHRPTAPSTHCPLVGSWSDCHAVLWITDHQTQHSPWSTSFVNSTTLCVMHQPAHCLTSPRVDRQTAVADHFVIRTSIRAEAQGQPPASSCSNHIPPSLSRSNRSNCYIQLLGMC